MDSIKKPEGNAFVTYNKEEIEKDILAFEGRNIILPNTVNIRVLTNSHNPNNPINKELSEVPILGYTRLYSEWILNYVKTKPIENCEDTELLRERVNCFMDAHTFCVVDNIPKVSNSKFYLYYFHPYKKVFEFGGNFNNSKDVYLILDSLFEFINVKELIVMIYNNDLKCTITINTGDSKTETEQLQNKPKFLN